MQILFILDSCDSLLDSLKVSDSHLIYDSPKWILRAKALSMTKGLDCFGQSPRNDELVCNDGFFWILRAIALKMTSLWFILG